VIGPWLRAGRKAAFPVIARIAPTRSAAPMSTLASNETERFRRSVTRCHDSPVDRTVKDDLIDAVLAKVERLEAENAKLRAALREIYELPGARQDEASWIAKTALRE